MIGMLTGQTPNTRELFEGLTWGLYEAGKSISASQYLMAKEGMNSARAHDGRVPTRPTICG